MKSNLDAELQRKREIAINDFNLLSSSGNIGFYTNCQLTQVFLIDLEANQTMNCYTLINFEESEYSGSQRFLTKSPKNISDRFKVGVLQKNLTIDETKNLFENMTRGSFFLGANECLISESLVLLPKQYVPQLWDSNNPFISNVLKPNFWGDSYIIEFFDEAKPVLKILTRKEVDKINKIVSDLGGIRINLDKVYERIGNIIFQFPVTIIKSELKLVRDESSVEVSFYKHPKLTEDLVLNVSVKTSVDNLLTGYNSFTMRLSEKTKEILLGDSYGIEAYVSNQKNSLIYYATKANFVKTIVMQMHLANSEPRIFELKNKNVINLTTSSNNPMVIGDNNANNYANQIFRRVKEEEIIKSSGDYFISLANNEENAKEFIRKKLNAGSWKEICLWDPYLTAADIIEILYFEKHGTPFKCITSYKAVKNNYKNNHLGESLPAISDILKEEANYLFEKSNNYNIKIEFRCRLENKGYDFHDRFLIFVPIDDSEIPKAFSLGVSVNSLGKHHHIIQKITNPRIILNNFYNLWEELESEECLIIKLPDKMKR